MELLLSQGWLAVLAAAWVGLCVGSFLNVVVHRLPIMLERDFAAEARDVLSLDPEAPDTPFNLMVPRSRCPKCGHQISAIENVPVISWVVLRGRCGNCSAKISARYPLVELTTMALTLAVTALWGFTWPALWLCVLTWMLLSAALIDADTMLLPDQLTYPLLWLGLLVNLSGDFTSLESAVIGAVAGYLSLWLIFWLFKLATGKEGMGYGDFKLLAALGAWMGWAALPSVVMLAAVSGLVFALANMALGGMRREEPMPFGPFLAAGGWVALVLQVDLSQLIMR